jgi:hypothetical protein
VRIGLGSLIEDKTGIPVLDIFDKESQNALLDIRYALARPNGSKIGPKRLSLRMRFFCSRPPILVAYDPNNSLKV